MEQELADQEQPTTAGAWLNRTVLGMGLTSLLADLSYETATTVLPAFLQALGSPVYALGLIEGVADAVSSFVKLGAGWFSDRLGRRKPLVTAGYLLTGAAPALFAAAVVWPMVFAGRVLAWFGRGFRGPARNALLAESVAEADRGTAFGFHRAGDTVGAVLGPLCAAGLLQWLGPAEGGDTAGPYRLILWLTLIPGLGAAAAFALLVRERRRSVGPARHLWGSVRALPGPFRRFLVGIGLFGAGDFSHTLLILAAIEMLRPAHGHLRAAQLGALLYVLRNVVSVIAAYVSGALSDRYGRRGLLVGGYVLGALVMLGFAAAFTTGQEGLGMLAVLFGLAGVFIAVEEALEGAMAADLVPATDLRGTAFGVLGMVNSVGDLVSSLAVGLLWAYAPAFGFTWAAAFMLLGAGLLWVLR
jgi:MFS family permease